MHAAGRENDARRVVSELLESAPEATCEFNRERIPLRDEVAMERWMDLLAAAAVCRAEHQYRQRQYRHLGALVAWYPGITK